MSQNSGSFYCFFLSGSFFLLTQAEKRAFSQLKAVISASVSKKKEPLKRTAILGHVIRLLVSYTVRQIDVHTDRQLVKQLDQ